MPNRLADASSPYLLQHQNNPVDWYPWTAEALERSRELDRPIFLSIGYSACHWCHVMEHESFEDEAIAELLNERFVCIKVDREERPDLDQIYMNAVQLMTGHGGWPMSVFLTPELQPFFGGTYWPPEPRPPMPGFKQVILAVEDAWNNRREQAVAQAGEITGHLAKVAEQHQGSGEPITEALLTGAAARLERVFDFTHGGFGRAPKFPHAMDLQLLLRVHRRNGRDGLLQMVRLNLDKMAHGGIYDHLAGGFARYSVDERWLVPHFEKMLYDNGLLTVAYLEACQVTGHAEYAQTVRETLDYILRYMTDTEGGFHSTEDADSEGVEGKFYVWTPDEVIEVLGAERGERFCYVYDVTDTGNFEGNSILNLPKTIAQCAELKGWDVATLAAELAADRHELLAVRDRRIRPGKDDKILVSWNALMIEAMARAASVLDSSEYLAAAQRAARFLLNELRDQQGRLLHTWRHGKASLPAYLDDYSYLANALVTLYQADWDESWVDEAVQLADVMLARFADRERGGFFFTADDHEQLITRNKDVHDSSVPSGNSMAATALLRLGTLCGRTEYLDAARAALAAAQGVMEQSPTAAGQMLIAADLAVGPLYEVVVVGDPNDADTSRLIAQLRSRYLPNAVLAFRKPGQAGSPALDPLFAGKTDPERLPAVYVCEQFGCRSPAVGLAAARDEVERLINATT